MNFRMNILILKFASLVFLIAPQVYSATLEERLTGFKVGGHRGVFYSDNDPNSLEAFEEAIKQKADIIELDLNLSKDGVVFVFHSDSMDKDTDCSGMMSQKNAADIYGCKYNEGRRIITFEEALAKIGERAVINAEFKNLNVIEPAIELIRKYDAYERVYFQANVDKNKYAKARAYDAHVALLFAPPDQASFDWALALDDKRLLVIELHENIRTRANIAQIKAAGKFSSENAWHESSGRERFGASCRWVFDLGINIAISNKPGGCVKQRNRYSQ